MWISKQMKPAAATADADLGVTTISGRKAGVLTRGEVRTASEAAYAEYARHMARIRAEGARILEQARAEGRRIILLAGRP